MTYLSYRLSNDRLTWQRRGRQAIRARQPARFAGDQPGRVILGFAAPESPRTPPRLPLFADAHAILNRTVYARRVYDGGDWISAAKVDQLVAQAQSYGGAMAVASWRVPNFDWAGLAAGTYDAALTTLANKAKAKRTVNGGDGVPFFAILNHEPDGEGPLPDPTGTDRLACLTLWANAQKYWIDFFSGWRTGSYVAGDDVRDIMPTAIIPNGNWQAPYKPDRIAAGLPDDLIMRILRANTHVMPDIYDAAKNPTSKRMLLWMAWGKAVGLTHMGCGEFGCVSSAELTRVWTQVLRPNRDFWTVLNYYGALGAFPGDPRLLPVGYPVTDPTHLYDLGGTVQTEAMLATYRTMLDESVSPTWSSPL